MVGNLQTTLMSKNHAMHVLQEKSRSLKKVMQPRLAYKYKAQRSNSNSHNKNDFMNLTQLQSSKEFFRDNSNDSGNGPIGYFGNIRSRSNAPNQTFTVSPKETSDVKSRTN
jgi:hypothetical protein